MSLTDRGAQICLRALRGEVLSAQNFYLSLHLGQPSVGSNEVGSGGYARVQIPSGSWSVSGRVQTSTSAIIFPTPTEDWGTPLWAGVYDSVTGGNLIWESKLPSNVSPVKSGDPVSIGVGSLTMSIGV